MKRNHMQVIALPRPQGGQTLLVSTPDLGEYTIDVLSLTVVRRG